MEESEESIQQMLNEVDIKCDMVKCVAKVVIKYIEQIKSAKEFQCILLYGPINDELIFKLKTFAFENSVDKEFDKALEALIKHKTSKDYCIE